MFTGLVETTGEVSEVEFDRDVGRLSIWVPMKIRHFKKGDSVAVNGCCLTVVRQRQFRSGVLLGFDLLAETWKLTNFDELSQGCRVNIERSLRGDSRLGGHFVSGHVDGCGTITRWEGVGQDWRLEIKVPKKLLPFLVLKGSVAVDGISLTIADLKRDSMGIWIIPHTRAVTNLQDRRLGEKVNLETDLIGKYIVQFLEKMPPAKRAR